MQKHWTDAKKQFSKWLAKYGAYIWGAYIFAILGLMAYQPETAMACVWLTLIVTINKALDGLQYTDNSKTEKILLAALDKTQMELTLKGVATSSKSEKEDTDHEEGFVTEEEGDNG